ncbi:MAG: stage III sporulation protein AF [Clostridium sp.]|nr:stage III sporulation protein AF [Clostridium sp.]
MELINNFIVTLVTTLIFITAIELVAPENSMKKYLKFVLGLMLIAVILNPIVNFFTKGQVFLDDLIDKYTKEVSTSKDEKETKVDNKEVMEKSFKNNFNRNCINILSKKFPEFNFTSDMECKLDFTSTTFEITSLKITVEEKEIRKIEKIDLSKEKNNEEDDVQKKIKQYISDELEIDKDKIVVNHKGDKEE